MSGASRLIPLPSFIMLLPAGAHFWRSGQPGLAAACIVLAALAWSRAAWVRLLLLLLAQALLLLHELGIDGLGAELQRAEQVLQLPEVEDVFGDVFAPFGLGYIHDVVFVSLLSVRCVSFRLPQHVRRASHCMKKPDRLR